MKTPCRIEFVEPIPDPVGGTPESLWNVLAVGWDPYLMALVSSAKLPNVMGSPVIFQFAKDSAGLLDLLSGPIEFSVIFLNADDPSASSAELELVRLVRSRGHAEPRIIVHSERRLDIPESVPSDDFDVCDFSGKKSIDRRKLVKVITSSVRAYHQIHRLNRSNRVLRQLAQLTTKMVGHAGIADCARIATEAAITLLGGECGCMCLQGIPGAITFQYRAGCTGTCAGVRTEDEQALVQRALNSKASIYTPTSAVLYVPLEAAPEAAAILIKGRPAQDELTHRFSEILTTQIAAAMNQRRFTQRIEKLALHDAATGLPNHLAIEREIDLSLEREGGRHCVNLVHVETFGEIEASLGEGVASAMVHSLAHRLTAPGSQVGRVSANQLVVYGPPLGGHDTPVPRELNEAIHVLDMHLPVSLTVGISETTGVLNGREAIQRARTALREARNCHDQRIKAYNQSIATAATRRLLLISDMRSAIDDRSQFQVHYQPQIDMRCGKVIGAEALLRWARSGTFISPAEFIPLAETSGLIRQIGMYAITEGIHQAALWQSQGTPITVAINLSASQLGDGSVLDAIARAMEEHAVRPELIEFELTETAAATHEEAASMLVSLRKMGFRIAIDDFGTGYSSLQRLADQPFDRVKIDREFVLRAPTSKPHRVVCKMAVNLAKSLGISVLAEGVETPEQARVLGEMGCHEAQGFLYGRAVPANQFSFAASPVESRRLSFMESIAMNFAPVGVLGRT